jgi:hypothetical protein
MKILFSLLERINESWSSFLFLDWIWLKFHHRFLTYISSMLWHLILSRFTEILIFFGYTLAISAFTEAAVMKALYEYWSTFLKKDTMIHVTRWGDSKVTVRYDLTQPLFTARKMGMGKIYRAALHVDIEIHENQSQYRIYTDLSRSASIFFFVVPTT